MFSLPPMRRPVPGPATASTRMFESSPSESIPSKQTLCDKPHEQLKLGQQQLDLPTKSGINKGKGLRLVSRLYEVVMKWEKLKSTKNASNCFCNDESCSSLEASEFTSGNASIKIPTALVRTNPLAT